MVIAMGWRYVTAGLAVLGWGQFLFSASAAPDPSRLLGGSTRPFSINDLPPSALRDRINSLPAPAQARAEGWLRTFEFPPEDVTALHVDHEGGVLYTCEFPAVETTDEPPEPILFEDSQAAPIPVAPFPDSSKFHSRPGSTNIIYLDFDGHIIVGTAWNNSLGRTQITARAFSTDSDASLFSDTEQAAIKRIWQRVAEDFAPFDVDVTTEAPASFHNRVSHCLITRNTDVDGHANPSSSAGGVAYVGIFAGGNSAYSSPAWVYHNNLSNSEANIAEAASHEIGHNLGLSHDGILNGATYYNGHGTGVTSWGPIMGTGYGRNISQWSRGEYYLANNSQDDLIIIAGKLSYRPDEADASPTTAPFIQLINNRFIQATTPETDPADSSPVNKGIISFTNDTDMWAFVAGTGTVSISVRPWIGPSGPRGGNLDIKAELLNPQGVVLASSDPTSETIADISATVDAGLYYLRIQNSSFGNPTSSTPTGFTSFGCVGRYFITGMVADATGVMIAPTAAIETLADVTAAGAPSHTLTIRYTDNTGIDTASLGNDDITVTGPNGFSTAATLTSIDTGNNGTPQIATYTFIPPGGSWDQPDNGTFNVWLNAQAVSDVDGSFAEAGPLGTVEADISPYRYQATMDLNPMWTVSGSWEFGVPNGSNGDPPSGDTGPQLIGYNLNGRYSRNLATAFATTPNFSCAYTESVTMRFKRWLGVANGDTASLQVRSESTTWTTMWSSSGTIADTAWQSIEFDISAIAAGRTNVQVRWGLASNSDSTTHFGWNIDDVEIDATYVTITTVSYGVPLWWLNQYAITNDPEIAVTSIGANGFTIWQSYIAGLDPTDPASTFEVLPPEAIDQQEIVLQWNPVSGRVYSVYRMSEPGAEAIPIPDAQNLTWPQSSYTNQPGAEATGILQIRVRLP